MDRVRPGEIRLRDHGADVLDRREGEADRGEKTDRIGVRREAVRDAEGGDDRPERGERVERRVHRDGEQVVAPVDVFVPWNASAA